MTQCTNRKNIILFAPLEFVTQQDFKWSPTPWLHSRARSEVQKLGVSGASAPGRTNDQATLGELRHSRGGNEN